MTDILLTAYLTALADGDLDTAREVASLADDPDAVDALLADDGGGDPVAGSEVSREAVDALSPALLAAMLRAAENEVPTDAFRSQQ